MSRRIVPPVVAPIAPLTATLTARKYKVENVNRNMAASYLDKLHAEGGVLVSLNTSYDIGGTFEVVSYKDVGI